MELASRIPMAGRIPDSLSCFLDSKAPDSGFLKQNFPDSTFLKQEFLGLRNLDSLNEAPHLCIKASYYSFKIFPGSDWLKAHF